MRIIVAAVIAMNIGGHTRVFQGQAAAPGERAAVLQEFQERVAAYVRLHRRLEEPLPPMTRDVGSWSMLIARRYLASAIRHARPAAQQGDIFFPAAASVFRQIFVDALEGQDAEAFLREFYEPHSVTHAVHPYVNEPYPTAITHDVPPLILQRLPTLCEHLEYRVVGHDLLLWDVHAELVVDFVPDAFPRAAETEE